MLETQTPSCWWFCLISAPVSKFFPAGLFGVLLVTTYDRFCEPSKSIFRRNTTETKMKRSKKIKLQRDILNIWTWRFWEQTIEKLARAWRASLMREIDTFESFWRRTDRKCDFSRSNTWKSRGRRRSEHGNNNLRPFSSYLDTLFLQNPATKDVLTA